MSLRAPGLQPGQFMWYLSDTLYDIVSKSEGSIGRIYTYNLRTTVVKVAIMSTSSTLHHVPSFLIAHNYKRDESAAVDDAPQPKRIRVLTPEQLAAKMISRQKV